MESLQPRDWEQRFEQTLKSEIYEQFNMLLCNPSRSSAEQKALLHRVLFEDHQNPRHWNQYLAYLTEKYPQKKDSLITLVFKALSVIPEASNKDQPDFIRLHLRLASLDQTGQPIQARQRYRIMQKRGIGSRSAEFYVQYAQFEQEQAKPAVAKQILERGMAAHAEPRHLLIHALDDLKQHHSELSSSEESVVDLNKSAIDPGTDKIEFKTRRREVSTIASATPRTKAATIDNDDDTRPLTTIRAAAPIESKEDNVAATPRLAARAATRKRKEEDAASSTKPVKRIGLSGMPKRVTTGDMPGSPTVEFKRPGAPADKENADPLQTPARSLRRTETFPAEKTFEMPQPRTQRKPTVSVVRTPYASRVGVNDETVTLGKPGQQPAQETSNSPTIEMKVTQPVDAKELKRKYIDDKLIGFDPEKFTKRRSSNTSSSSAESGEGKRDGNASNTSMRSDDSQHTSASKRSGGGRTDVINRSRGSEENTAAHGAESGGALDESVAQTDHRHEYCDQSRHVSFMVEPLEQSGLGYSFLPSAIRPFQSLLDADKVLHVQGRPYLVLDLLGKGGSSKVYRVLATTGQTYAFKRVEMKGSEDIHALVESYSNEIKLMQRLRGNPHIIQLVDHEIDVERMVVSMVMEVGEVDLAKVLHQQQRSSEQPKQNSMALSLNFIRLTWQQMLEAVQCIHDNRIVHGDLKPANFVFVKGQLKLIDFGIAKAISNDTTNIVRESQIGTVNYMAPEAISPIMVEADDEESPRMKLGRASDIWSMGCILYQMVYGRPPFANLNTIQKLHAIPNPKHRISYPDYSDISVVACMKTCLQRDPKDRPPIEGPTGLLAHAFLHPVTAAAPSEQPAATTTPAAPAQSLSLVTVRSIVKLALANADEINTGKLDRLTLCEQIYGALSKGTDQPLHASQPLQPLQQQTGTETPSHTKKSKTKPRTPLRALPTTIKDAIQGPNHITLRDSKTSDSQKWMRPKGSTPEKHDLRTVIEKRLEEIRQYQEREDDTCGMSIDGWTIHEDL